LYVYVEDVATEVCFGYEEAFGFVGEEVDAFYAAIGVVGVAAGFADDDVGAVEYGFGDGVGAGEGDGSDDGVGICVNFDDVAFVCWGEIVVSIESLYGEVDTVFTEEGECIHFVHFWYAIGICISAHVDGSDVFAVLWVDNEKVGAAV